MDQDLSPEYYHRTSAVGFYSNLCLPEARLELEGLISLHMPRVVLTAGSQADPAVVNKLL